MDRHSMHNKINIISLHLDHVFQPQSSIVLLYKACSSADLLVVVFQLLLFKESI